MQKNNWRVYIADAFAKELYAGNQAGVVILEEGQDFPEDITMCKIAGELKHSETAFVKKTARDAFHIRYFTPVEEVDLCGHATIASFSVLKKEHMIEAGDYHLMTRAQELLVTVGEEAVWMEMASPKELYTFTDKEAEELYAAYGLTAPGFAEERAEREADGENGTRMVPKIVSTGLCDIMLPVADQNDLNRAVQNEQRISDLSEKYQVVGVHMFCISGQDGVTAECRNFAPLYGIPEESATGTSNGALTYYLYQYGMLMDECENVFLQGEAMGKPSYVKSRLTFVGDEKHPVVQIGGTAVISLKGELMHEE